MRQNTLIALAVITVPILAAAIFWPSGHGSEVKPVETGPVFPALKDWLGGAAKLIVTSAGSSVTLTRPAPAAGADAATLPADGWVLPDKGNYPVQPGLIRPVIAGLGGLHTIEAKTERPKLYDRLDVEDPGAAKDAKSKLIELDNANGASIVKLIIGKRRYDPVGGNGDALYIRKPDEERAWLAQPAFDLPADALGWIDHKILDIDPDKIKSLTLTPAGGKPLVLERDKAEDKLAVRDAPKDATFRSETPGSDIAAGFRYLDLLDVKPAAQVTGAAAATVDVVTFDGLAATVSLYDQPGGPWLEVTAKATGDAAKDADEIVKRTNGWAYKVAEPRAKLLQSKLADLLTPVAPPTPPAQTPAPSPVAPAKPAAKPGK